MRLKSFRKVFTAFALSHKYSNNLTVQNMLDFFEIDSKIVVENGFYESYFTEKILDCFASGTIPVYMGSPDIDNYFNSEGIIPLTEEFDVSEDIYYDKMEAIKDNLERVRQYEILEDFIYLNYFKK